MINLMGLIGNILNARQAHSLDSTELKMAKLKAAAEERLIVQISTK